MPASLARTEDIPVEFTIEHDDFGVDHPAFEGLRCSATYRVFGTVTEDRSGDLVTPHGTPEVELSSDLVAYDICLVRDDLSFPLSKALQELLATEFATEFDDAFIAAVGGMVAIEWTAMEKAA